MSVQEKINKIESNITKEKKNNSKEYNAEYYSKHKKEILSKLCEKVECNLCGRVIIRNNLNKHKMKPICRRVMERNIEEAKLLQKLKSILGEEIKLEPKK